MTNFLAASAKSGGNPPAAVLIGILGWGEITGTVLLIVGLCFYAKAKGYPAALGLLGLLSCIGLLILAVLPDKTKDKNTAVS